MALPCFSIDTKITTVVPRKVEGPKLWDQLNSYNPRLHNGDHDIEDYQTLRHVYDGAWDM